MSTLCEIEVVWSDAELIIKNAPPALLKNLHYYHKSLQQDEKNKFKRVVKKEKVAMYRQLEGGLITTFQGFLDRVTTVCRSEDLPLKLIDARQKLPPPKLVMAQGFRHSQRLLFFQTLGQNRSGICKAPTRYGKTALIANMLRVYDGVRCAVTAPGVSLLEQLRLDLKKWLPNREIKGLYTGSRDKVPSPDITLVSMDSLAKCEPETVRLLLVDEPHAAVAPSRIVDMMRFRNARILGFGATITGRFDGADALVEGIIGPVLAQRTFQEAVAEGAICPITVYFLKVPFMPWDCRKRDAAYRQLIFKNPQFNKLVNQIQKAVIPAEWQTIIFVDEIKQAELIQTLVTEGVMAVAAKMNKQTREETYTNMVENVIKRCIATDIYATGLTFPDLRVMINTAGGGGAITATQKPGRLAQVRPGKKAGYVIDFLFEPCRESAPGQKDDWRAVVVDGFARMNTYKKTGFDVRVVNRVEDIRLE